MAKPKNIKISIVIPAYNEQGYIGAALRSLKQQSFRDFEVIVVDNNSTDATAREARDQGARVIFEPKRGVCAARQTGTLGAKGEIIVSTDADTTFPRHWLSKIVKGFDDPSAMLVAGPCEFVDPALLPGLLYKSAQNHTIKLYQRTGFLWYVWGANLAFRKSAWDEAGQYNPQLTQAGDEMDLLRRLRPLGKVVALTDNPVKTSSRRINRGVGYTLVSTGRYFTDYFLARLTGKNFTGSYKPIRTERPSLLLRAGLYSMYLLGFLIASHALLTHTALAHSRRIQQMGHYVKIHRPNF